MSTAASGGSGTASVARRRAPATAAAGLAASITQRSQAVRMNLFVLVRILFQYLERVDKGILDLAKEVLKDCERKHNTKDSKYETLADAIGERVRDAVGEKHWTKAREIQKQLAANQQRKKLKAMQAQRQRNQKKKTQEGQQGQGQMGQQQPQVQHKIPQEGGGTPAAARDNEAMDVAMTLSGMSQQASPAATMGGTNTTTNNGSTGGSKPSGQLPLRKRIMLGSSPGASGDSSNMSGPDFTKMRR